MKKLSIIIVSYNVSPFLEKCLRSVFQALQGLDADVIVIDNHSVDDSVAMVRKKFPAVRLIANEVNVGFGRANNQAMAYVSTPYVLLLNPDTLINEDTFMTCLAFMDSHPEAAVVGVKMFDGSGNFLPESKRGFPTPWRALCKMTGLSALLPHSKVFNGYYLGHLDPDKTHEIEVLCGAFMFIRTEAMRKVGGFDEAFFMYGEDIDLSYRFVEAGYRNYYLPTTSIIHYKGESAKKSTLNYVRSFYNAMLIFLDKHYAGIRHLPLVLIIKAGIFLRAFISGVSGMLRSGLPVIFDAGAFAAAILAAQAFWSQYYYHDPSHFDENFFRVNLPLYAGCFLVFSFLAGAYDRYYALRRLFAGILSGTLAILVIYAMLNSAYRSSRAVIILSGVIGLGLTILLRLLAHRIQNNSFRLGKRMEKHALLIAGEAEAARIMELLNRSDAFVVLDAVLSPESEPDPEIFDSSVGNLEEVLEIYGSDELIFSAHDVPFREITFWMNKLGNKYEFKVATPGSEQIVGSKSRTYTGELYTVDFEFRLARGYHRRNKRMFDMASASMILLFSPFLLLVKNGKRLVTAALSVLIGRKTWIGYHPADPETDMLPRLKPAIFNTVPGVLTGENAGQVAKMKNVLYAKEYSIWKDLELVGAQVREIDRDQVS